MSKTRAIRFSEEEERLIRAFLAENPIFDFSTLTRVSIRQFIQNPKLELKKIKDPTSSRSKRRSMTL